MKKILMFIFALSVRIKLAILIFFVVLSISSVSILINIDMHKNHANLIINELIQTNINSNKQFVSEFILTKDHWELYKFLKTLSASEIIDSAGFIDKHKSIVAHTDTKKYRIGDAFEDFEFFSVVPFVQDGVEFGSFVLEVQKQTFMNLLIESFFVQFILLFAVAILSFLFANIFMGKLLNRLDLLSNNAQAMIEKRWDDIIYYKGFENDEITKIIENTTKLMRELKNSIEKEEKNARISHSLSILGEISSSFAHEVKNLMQPLKLLIPKETPPDREDMPIIHNALMRIDHQVVDFLALAKPIDFTLDTPLHVKPIVDEVISILSPKANKRGVKIEMFLQESFLVKLNEKATELIVINLLTNAIDAAYKGSTIDFRWDKVSSDLSLLCIINQGETMTQKTKENLFKPFFTTKKDGSGLGLFSIYKIVYLSGGHIEFESNNEQTKFCLYIPIKEEV
jgi:signal transduction histidine kinase